MTKEFKLRSEQKARQDALGEKIWFDMSSLLSRVEMQLNAVARSRGKIIGISISEQAPTSCFGYPLFLTDIFNNLTSYCLFHLDAGGIFFDIQADLLGPDRYRFNIVATTTGLGLLPWEMRAVFTPAYQKGGQGNSSLYISKTLSGLMDGDLSIENTFGWGTRFIVNIVLESAISNSSIYQDELPDQIECGCANN